MRTYAAGVVLGLLTAACAPGSPAVRPGDVPGFSARQMIDVLAPDAIRPIDEPAFARAATASWPPDAAPVVIVELDGVARAYPLAILMFHEVVNDVVAGRPVAVTYAPGTGGAVVYERRAGTDVIQFGSSGKLYRGNPVLFDRKSTSLWPQMQGVAVLGEYKGVALARAGSTVGSFGEFRAAFPDGEVLARPGGAGYTTPSYAGYDRRAQPLRDVFVGELDERLPPMTRIAGVETADGSAAIGYEALARARVLHVTVGSTPVAIFFDPATASPYDPIADARATGSAHAFEPFARGRRLSFAARGGAIVDAQTGSRWSPLGRATAGPLRGAILEQVAHHDAFWFAWAAFHADTAIANG